MAERIRQQAGGDVGHGDAFDAAARRHAELLVHGGTVLLALRVKPALERR
ncbi:hypothetical protein [Burkholderia sp. IMCC1007]|nr:hypothetical protein [Burkholderia sp. IMCC1007]